MFQLKLSDCLGRSERLSEIANGGSEFTHSHAHLAMRSVLDAQPKASWHLRFRLALSPKISSSMTNEAIFRFRQRRFDAAPG